MEGKTEHERLLAADGGQRAGLITALVDLEVFYETHPTAPVPTRPTLSIRIPDGDDSARTAAVDAVAEALGVHARWMNGCYIAARQFGPLTLEAHFTPALAKLKAAQRILRGEKVAAA